MKTIAVASSNENKIREIGEILKGYNVVSAKSLGFTGDVEETGASFKENAKIKAEAVYEFLKGKYAVLADDSGLSVKALNNEPGVYSARYAGEPCDDNKNIDKLLKKMEGVKDRSAKFVCMLAFIENGEIFYADGETCGEILTERRGDKGFGYDPVFYSKELKKSFGEAEEQEKNAVSHRYNALKKLYKTLKERK